MPILPFTPLPSVLPLFFAHFPGSGPAWEDLVVAQDFGLLQPDEILAWLGAGGYDRPLTRAMVECGRDGARFERALWAACREVLGSVPRPGHRLWEIAQDRWRVVLLDHALRKSEEGPSLGRAVMEVYDNLGCPEDMVGLWGDFKNPVIDKDGVEGFIRKLENGLSVKGCLPMPLAV